MSAIVIRSQNDLKKLGGALDKIKYKKQNLSKVLNGSKLITKNIFNFLKKSLKVISRTKVIGDFSITSYVAGKNGLSTSGELKKFLKNKNFDLKNLQNIKNEYENQKRNKSQIVDAKKRCSKQLGKVIEELQKLRDILSCTKYAGSLSNAMVDCGVINVTSNEQNPFSALSKTLTKFLELTGGFFSDIESVYEDYEKRMREIVIRDQENNRINDQVNIYNFIENLNKYDEWYQLEEFHAIAKDFGKVYTDNSKQITTVYTTIVQLVTRSVLLVKEIIKELGNLIECPDKKHKEALDKVIEEWDHFTKPSFDGRTEIISEIISNLNLKNMSFENGVKEEKNFGNSRPNVKNMARNLNLAQRKGQSVGKDFFVPQGQLSNGQSQNLEKLKQAKKQLEKIYEYMKKMNSTFEKRINDSKITNRIDIVLHTIDTINKMSDDD